jgi:hypothetical protein
MKAMEALLVGVLQREKPLAKTSAAEIEHLALLVRTFLSFELIGVGVCELSVTLDMGHMDVDALRRVPKY